jgi:hypothetical protein
MSVFAGVPAFAVPQYWQRAAGLVDILTAHAESKHRVRFAREHAAWAKPGATATHIAKNASFDDISLLN